MLCCVKFYSFLSNLHVCAISLNSYFVLYIYFIIYVTGTKTGLENEMMRFQTSVINGYLAWMLAGVQMNRGSSSVHVQWFSHQNNGADYHDNIK